MQNLPTVIADKNWNYPLFMEVYGDHIDIGYYYIPQDSFEDTEIVYLKRIKGIIAIETGIQRLKEWVETGIKSGRLFTKLRNNVDPRAYERWRIDR